MVCRGAGLFRVGADGQADAGDAAVCAVAAGLLAAGKNPASSIQHPASTILDTGYWILAFAAGENSVSGAGGGVLCGDVLGAAPWRGGRGLGDVAVWSARG